MPRAVPHAAGGVVYRLEVRKEGKAGNTVGPPEEGMQVYGSMARLNEGWNVAYMCSLGSLACSYAVYEVNV